MCLAWQRRGIPPPKEEGVLAGNDWESRIVEGQVGRASSPLFSFDSRPASASSSLVAWIQIEFERPPFPCVSLWVVDEGTPRPKEGSKLTLARVDSSHAATCNACASDRLWDVAQCAAGLPRGKYDLRTQTCGLFLPIITKQTPAAELSKWSKLMTIVFLLSLFDFPIPSFSSLSLDVSTHTRHVVGGHETDSDTDQKA